MNDEHENLFEKKSDPFEDAVREIYLNPKARYFLEWLFTEEFRVRDETVGAKPELLERTVGKLEAFNDILNSTFDALPREARLLFRITRKSSGALIAEEPQQEAQTL